MKTDALRGQHPNLIMLDLHMPNLDGFAFVDELNRREEWRSIPVLVVSAEPRLVQGLEGHSVDGFVAKPSGLERIELVVKVRELLPAG
jgi:CheY-like chemotaxis protein